MHQQPTVLLTVPELGRLASVPTETVRRRLQAAGIVPEFAVRAGSDRGRIVAFDASRTQELLAAIALR